MYWKLLLPQESNCWINTVPSQMHFWNTLGKPATKLFPNSLSDTCVMNVAQHKVALTGCLPTTAVVIIPVHSLCWRISAPWTNVLHCLGDNLCSCWCWIDDILIIRLKSKSLEEKASTLQCTETKQQVGCIKKNKWCVLWNGRTLLFQVYFRLSCLKWEKMCRCFLRFKIFLWYEKWNTAKSLLAVNTVTEWN